MGDVEIAIGGLMVAMNDMADNFKVLHSNLAALIRCLHQRDLALVFYARQYPLVEAEDLIAVVSRQTDRGTEQ